MATTRPYTPVPLAITSYVRAERHPRLSLVVVGSGAGERDLHATLTRIAPLCVQSDIEVVIVASSQRASLLRAFLPSPCVRFVAAPALATPEQLRRAGMAYASGDIVSIIEASGDHSRALAIVDRLQSLGGKAADMGGPADAPPPAAPVSLFGDDARRVGGAETGATR